MGGLGGWVKGWNDPPPPPLRGRGGLVLVLVLGLLALGLKVIEMVYVMCRAASSAATCFTKYSYFFLAQPLLHPWLYSACRFVRPAHSKRLKQWVNLDTAAHTNKIHARHMQEKAYVPLRVFLHHVCPAHAQRTVPPAVSCIIFTVITPQTTNRSGTGTHFA